jgi:hypothetical protein
MSNSSFEGKVALRVKQPRVGSTLTMLDRARNGQGWDAKTQADNILKDILEHADAASGGRLDPWSINVIAFDTNRKLADKKEQLTVKHLQAVLKKLGDDTKVWVSVSWKSKGCPPKLNIAQASTLNQYASRTAQPNPFSNGS